METIRKNAGHREILESLFLFATEGMIITGSDGKISDINPAVEKLFGYNKDELIGKPIEILVPGRVQEDHRMHRDGFYRNPHPRPMGAGMTLFAKRKDGSEFPVEISLSTFQKEGELFVASFIIDITKRKEQEDALHIAHKQLEQYARELAVSNKDLEEFAYVASHDLQEPLRKIQAFGDRLKIKESGIVSAEGVDYIDRMLKAAVRMQRLINDLLTFSRVTTKAKPFSRVDLNEILKDVLSDLEISIEKSKTKIEAGELPTLDADPVQMHQLFLNLISNAIKFRQEQKNHLIKVSVVPHPAGYTADNMVSISVEDNGIGFDTKYTDRIFNIFQRLEGDKFDGTGVGLAICKKIISRHNGWITVESRPGHGSKFIISLHLFQHPIHA